jgi:hypothetical protein
LATQDITPKPPLDSLYGLQPSEMRGWVAGHEVAVSLRLVQATKSLLEPKEWEGRRVTFKPEGKQQRIASPTIESIVATGSRACPVVFFSGQPIGTVAASCSRANPTSEPPRLLLTSLLVNH